jgi:outer membrane receptor protein involved in Fe transport
MRAYWGICGAVWASVLVTSQATAQETAAPAAKPDATPSTTVVVTAKTPPVVHKIDRTVYDLKTIILAETGTLGDVLNTLPSVNVSPTGAVTVRGSSVQILIDGKPSASLRGANLASTLQSMPANTIDKIEVITNPGAEFRTDAQTVINIITKKAHGSKPTGNIVVNTADEPGRYNATLSGSAGIGKWTFNGSLTTRQDKNNWVQSFDREGLAPDGSPVSRMTGSQNQIMHHLAESVDGTATYAATDKDNFTLSGHVSSFDNDRWTDNAVVFSDASGDPLSNPTTLSSGPARFDDDSLTGTWKHQGTRDGETFTLVAKHEESDIIDDQTYDEAESVPAVSTTDYLRNRTERQFSDELSGDYILPLATDTQFKAGFDFESDQDQAYNFAANIDPVSGAQTADPLFTSRFLSDQVLSAAYVDYQHPLGKWLVEGGLRVENLTTTIGAARGALASAASDLEWSPSLFLSRELTPHQKIKLTYSRRVDRPAPNQLTAVPIQIDAQDLFVGNPSLHPARTDSFEAGYDYTTQPVTFSATAYYRSTHDAITPYTYYSDPSDTVLVTSVENAGSASHTGLDMSLDLHPSPKVAYSLSSDIYYAEQTAPVGGVPLHQSIVTHQSRAMVTLTPKATDQFQITAMLYGPDLTADGHSTPYTMINLAYTHTFSPRLKFVATLQNALTTVHNRTIDRAPDLFSDTYWRPHDDTLFVGLNYKFGAIAQHQGPGLP